MANPTESSEPSSVEVVECVDDSGDVLCYERHEVLLSLSDFDHGAKYKVACEACPRHGRNLACPPYSPLFADYVAGTVSARVICLRLPTEYGGGEAGEERARAAFRRVRRLLTRELLEYRGRGHLIAGSGTCPACERCAAEDGGAECVRPEERVYSLESLGVNLVALARDHLAVDLEWSGADRCADFVCAVGAVFL